MGGNGYAAVSFDVGGTLLYSDPSPAEIYAHHLSRRGRAVRAEEVGPVFQEAWAEMQRRSAPGHDRYGSVDGGEHAWWGAFVREVLGRLDHDAPWEPLLEDLYANFSDPRVWRTFEGATETLAELARRGIRLAVTSNWDRRLPGILRGLDLLDRFQVVTVSSIAGVEKPAAAIFRHTLERLGVPSERTLHVGDSPLEDYAGAENAGLAAALIDRRGLFDRRSYRCIGNLTELLALVG